jgi:chorismate mutase
MLCGRRRVTDDRTAELRGRIDQIDAAIVDAVNERLRIVAELWRVKAASGAERVDPDRERDLRAALAARNEGPLSDRGLDELVDAVRALLQRELQR